MPKDLDEICTSGAEEAFGELDLVDLNVILHRADGEERDATGMSPVSARGSKAYWGVW
jgi:glycogen debranching enzyme